MSKGIIRELCEKEGYRVYILLPDETACSRFARQAGAEGITFSDHTKPTADNLPAGIALHRDGTISPLHINGWMAVQTHAKTVGSNKLLIIDYNEYCTGQDSDSPPDED